MFLFFGFLLIFFLGFGVTQIFLRRETLGEKIAAGYGLGLGILSFTLFVLGIFKIPLTAASTLVTLVFLNLILTFFLLKFKKISFHLRRFSFPAISLLDKLMIVFLIFLFLWVLLVSLYWPIYTWDPIALYDFRAKIFAQSHSLAWERLFTESPEVVSYYLSYPVNLSLLHTFVYLLGGENPQFLYAGFYVALILLFLANAQKIISQTLSLFFTLILATTPLILAQGTIAYPNIAYAFYYFAAVLFFIKFLSKKENHFLFWGSVFLGLAVLIRPQEPFWLVPLLLISPFIIKEKKIKIFILSLVIFFCLRQSWFFYRATLLPQMKEPFVITYHWETFRIGEVLQFLGRTLFKDFFPFFLLFLITTLKILREIKKFWFILGLVGLNIVFLFSGTYFLSFNYPEWQLLGDSVQRVSLFFIPLSLYFSLILFKKT